MLRVGLTGGLGSGKSTAAGMFAALGAYVLSADEIGRGLMQPGERVFDAIVEHFGPSVVRPDGTLNRGELARLAFVDGRVEELNAIVHPATIARQEELAAQIAAQDPHAVLIVESALIFETSYGGAQGGEQGWRRRFDRLILVAAPEEIKIARFVARASAGAALTPERREALEADARQRLARQIDDQQKAALCDYVLTNGGALTELEWQVDQLWPILQAAAHSGNTVA